ncbi:uncharacterized protein ACOB8E_012926 [Sarcophilus harrisii]
MRGAGRGKSRNVLGGGGVARGPAGARGFSVGKEAAIGKGSTHTDEGRAPRSGPGEHSEARRGRQRGARPGQAPGTRGRGPADPPRAGCGGGAERVPTRLRRHPRTGVHCGGKGCGGGGRQGKEASSEASCDARLRPRAPRRAGPGDGGGDGDPTRCRPLHQTPYLCPSQARGPGPGPGCGVRHCRERAGLELGPARRRGVSWPGMARACEVGVGVGAERRSEPRAGARAGRGGIGEGVWADWRGGCCFCCCCCCCCCCCARVYEKAGGRRPPLPQRWRRRQQRRRRRRRRRRRQQLTQPAARAETPLTARGSPALAPGAPGTRPLPPRHWPPRPALRTHWS